ncbi:MAG TPA: four helix bundle protein [Phycisphaerae bacterium]|nr:four helix bundle protein [Phycisphaerae bacterium]
MPTPSPDPLLPPHGGYHKLKSFHVAQLVYDVTERFCQKYIDPRSRTHDQMMQAARSGSQNIAEGSQASCTSRKTELKLTNVARASLEELRLDYQDFLRQRGLPIWDRHDPRRGDLVDRRPTSADAVAQWARDVKAGRCAPPTPPPQSSQPASQGPPPSTRSTSSTPPTYPEIAANGALALIAVARYLLDRQLAAQAASRRIPARGGLHRAPLPPTPPHPRPSEPLIAHSSVLPLSRCHPLFVPS